MAGLTLSWIPGKGWNVIFSALGTALLVVPVGTVLTAAAAVGGVAIGVLGTLVVSVSLYDWATAGNNSPKSPPLSVVEEERRSQGFEANASHVAVCGPAGSGKTSLVNALRGMTNKNPEAAPVGFNETTDKHTKYPSHSSLGRLFVHDFPGAGTQQFPASGYYNSQKLYLFDYLLILYGERFGEIELELVKACICNKQRFCIIRSKSDRIIDNLMDDKELDYAAAKQMYQGDTLQALGAVLKGSGVEDKQIEELLGYCFLVNKKDLQLLTSLSPSQWPQLSRAEISERNLLKTLRRKELDK